MDIKSLIEDFSVVARSGGIGPRLHPSLIGIDPESFVVTWPETFPKNRRFPIPEFVSAAFNGIDAYATALLASDIKLPNDELMRISASIGTDDSGELQIQYLALCGPGLIMLPKDSEVPLAMALWLTLETKSLRPKAIRCNELCAVTYQSWVGMMRIEDSALAGVEEASWPSAERHIHLTQPLREKATSVLQLLGATVDSRPLA